MTAKAKNTNGVPGRLRAIRCVIRSGRREEGSSLVEIALVSAFIYLPILFGIFQVSYGLYVYNFVCSAAHQATRYAAMRGVNSCVIQSNFVDCNLNPTGSTNSAPGSATPMQNYVQNMNIAGVNPSNLTVTTTWYVEQFTATSGFSVGDWSQSCGSASGSTAGGSSSCTVNGSSYTANNIGNAVQVQVTYQFPLGIPFWGSKTLGITGQSKMMISE